MGFQGKLDGKLREIVDWRHDFHANPELLYDLPRTSGIVAHKLRSFGCDEVITGVGKSGVVGVIKGKRQSNDRIVGLRADMDALPITEMTGKPYTSTAPGKMHACGHDGHTAMLLGAARFLAESRNFNGKVVLIFQPAEEGGAGAKAMLDDGLVKRFGVQEVYGMHNRVGLPVGNFAIRHGPILASADWFDIDISGRSGHAAKPHLCVDPVMIAGHLITNLQSITSRMIDPLEAAVISITGLESDRAYNVIPETVHLRGTVRALKPDVRDFAEGQIRHIAESTVATFGANVEIRYRRDYPVTINHREQTDFAIEVAKSIAGNEQVDTDMPPELGSEDFGFMLEQIPGAFIFSGNGDGSPHHHPGFDFNDELIPYGVYYWIKLIETRLT